MVVRAHGRYPSVTNARVNGDGGMLPDQMVASASLAAVLGIGWSKDNLQLGGQWHTAALQASLAALSLGPVGLADRLEGFPKPPTNTSAVRTNVSLARALATIDGTLLQPSVPLQPVAQLLMERAPLGAHAGHVWVTHTTVPVVGAPSAAPTPAAAVFFTALGFAHGVLPNNATTFAVGPATFAATVDAASPSPQDFAAVPTGSFPGTGAGTGAGVALVWWRPNTLVLQGAGTSHVATLLTEQVGVCQGERGRGRHGLVGGGWRGNHDRAECVCSRGGGGAHER